MMALNKVVAKKPTPLADLNMTLTDLGLEAQQLFSGPFGNVDNKNPDQLTQMYLGANQQVWWLMTTTELYNSLADQQGLVATIPGFLNMPSFDKVLMGDTPATSGFCLFYHLSEQHLYSQQLRDLKLVMFVPETRRQQRRLGSGNVDVFNRGYVFHQLQVQEGSLVNLSTWELNKQVVFNVKPIQDNTNFVQVIANKFSWENGFLWTYNVPLRPTDILTQEDNRMRCLLQCLQYTGGEVLAKLPTETTKHVHTLLATMHPMVQQQFQTDFQYFGAKTTERLRGNSTGSPSTMTNTMLTMSKAPTTTGINTNNKKLINQNGKMMKTTSWTGLSDVNGYNRMKKMKSNKPSTELNNTNVPVKFSSETTLRLNNCCSLFSPISADGQHFK